MNRLVKLLLCLDKATCVTTKLSTRIYLLTNTSTYFSEVTIKKVTIEDEGHIPCCFAIIPTLYEAKIVLCQISQEQLIV
jgi:hypothetical protein